MKSFHAIHDFVVLFNCIAMQNIAMQLIRKNHWHDSHVGSSTPQNLMSVAALADSAICDCAAAAAASNALDILVEPALSLPDETAFMRPLLTVDFSACVADMVRR
jgi:hypothetical protein